MSAKHIVPLQHGIKGPCFKINEIKKTIYIFINNILIVNSKYAYVSIAVINFATPDDNKVQEVHTHQNLKGMYSQSMFVDSPANLINTQGLHYKCI